MEYLLYGLAQDETREYMEQLLIATKNKLDIEKVRQYAIAKGFHSFRETTYNGKKPNFTNVLN
jgi:hypothetical protein